tara:strand:- start:544 stop:1017 length:474 start_codon:yes stop_codon:yes gene_type:complete
MKTEAELWKSIKSKTAANVHWTRIEARVGAGIPDINGAFLWPSNGRQSPIEIWVELKVCKTKRYKPAGLWRPAQIAWQTARSRYSGTVWNLVSHPDLSVTKIYGGSKVAGLQFDDTNQIPPDLVLAYGDPWSVFLDFAGARALEPFPDSMARGPLFG